MKQLLILIIILFTLTAQSQEAPAGYYAAPERSITGDFNGDGRQETLRQFMTDSTHHYIKYIKNIPDGTWDDYVDTFGSKGYSTAIAFKEATSDTLYFSHSQGVYCLINMGNLNEAKGDEIAVIPDLADQSMHSYCRIYSMCSGKWQQVFEFNVHEDAFDYTGDTMPVYTFVTGILEKRKGKWYFYDYLEMDYSRPEDVGQMKKLVVGDCEY